MPTGILKQDLYGFGSKKEAGPRAVGATVDTGYTRHIPKIPRITTGPGYLKMDFTQKMKDLLLGWYKDHYKGGKRDSVRKHEVISGGYTNNHVAEMSKIDLDDFRLFDYTLSAREVDQVFSSTSAHKPTPMICPGANVIEEVISSREKEELMVFCEWSDSYLWDEVAAFSLPDASWHICRVSEFRRRFAEMPDHSPGEGRAGGFLWGGGLACHWSPDGSDASDRDTSSTLANPKLDLSSRRVQAHPTRGSAEVEVRQASR